ncbi:MAG: hypothetical protein RLZZ427_245 [Pseudomonadota bacterium]|jgi:hypothetical protein
MKHQRLTKPAAAATSGYMQKLARYRRTSSKDGRSRAGAVALLVIGALALGGCISVNAPDKPIVIELNINIKQEVVYRLAADAGKTVDSNASIF